MEENEEVKVETAASEESVAPEETVTAEESQVADEVAPSAPPVAEEAAPVSEVAVSNEGVDGFAAYMHAKKLFPYFFIGIVFPAMWLYLFIEMLKFYKYKKAYIAAPIVGFAGIASFTFSTFLSYVRAPGAYGNMIGMLNLLFRGNITGWLMIFGAIIASFVIVCQLRHPVGNVAKVVRETLAVGGASVKNTFENNLLLLANAKNYAGFQKAMDDAHENYLSVKDEVLFPEEAEKEIQQIYVEEALSTGNKDGAKALKKRLEALYKARNYTELNKIRADYKPRMESRRLALLAENGGQEVPLECDGKSTFDGTVLQRIGVTLLTCFVTLITLGLAFPAMLCYQMRWECKHTVYNGKRLSFDGTGMQLLGKWIVWLLLSVLTLGIYGFFVAIKLEQWKAKHTHIAGEAASLGGTFDGGVLGNLWRNLVGGLLVVLSLGLAIPYVLCMKERWAARHRIYDGRRLSFDGKAMGLFRQFIKWWLLSIVTLGIYAWWIPNKMLKWKAEHTQLSENQEVASLL